MPHGTYARSDNASFPATLSDFRLDKFEVTVGRFRKFVAAYSQNMISSGAGKNPNNAADPGWDPAWNANLPATAAALVDTANGTTCVSGFQTWTPSPGPNENRPINCVTWFEAYAFCAWDGGRLPTEAEWNYAAAGGSEQRPFPWGPTVPSADAKLAIYGCFFKGTGTCFGVDDIASVGSVPAGNAKWGQSDLGGNVFEWVLDSGGSYSNPCVDCANIPTSNQRQVRGGDFKGSTYFIYSYQRSTLTATQRNLGQGMRCARAP